MQSSAQIELASSTPIPPKVGFWAALSANVLNMVGVGPFLTIPLALAAMGGPQAMLGWVLGAVLALCDGMVWAELGSAMPLSGGPYHYLLEAFGARRFGRIFGFLFLWQAIVLGPISIAGGAVGFSQYAVYLYPKITHWQGIGLAAAVCLLNTALLYRGIRSISRLSIGITAIVLGSMAWIIWAGIAHFHLGMAFDFPPGAFRLGTGFFWGLGQASLIAMYDYGGYYNVCLFAGEVTRPGKTIPRSILVSILLIAVLYLAMNVSIIGVIPWRHAMHSQAIAAEFMESIYGKVAGTVIAILVLIAAFGSVFAILLGYSRIPYAAATQGQFFSIFARLHPRGRFPHVALLAMGVVSALACIFSLESLVTALIVTQTLLQFAAQCVAVVLLRRRKKLLEGAYRMPWFPLPALIALAGWLYIVATSGWTYIALAGLFLAIGIAIFLVRARVAKTWPFDKHEVTV